MTDGQEEIEVVRAQLLGLRLAGVDAAMIQEDCLLIEDLGMDSLKFVDLTVALEEALGCEEFPMQEWVDERMEAQLPLSVGALAAACRRVARGELA